MKRPVTFLVTGLFVFTAAVILYRVVWVEYPVLPITPGQTWGLTIYAHIKDDNGRIKLAFGLPADFANRTIMEERFFSGALNFNIINEGQNRFGVWSRLNAPSGEETVYYRVTVLLHHKRFSQVKPEAVKAELVPIGDRERALARRLAVGWGQLAPEERILAVARTATGMWGTPGPGRQDLEAWSTLLTKHGPLKAILILFQAADLPARSVEGLYLREGVTAAPIKWIEVWNGAGLVNVSVERGEVYQENVSLLPLASEGAPAVKVSSGILSDIRWVVTRQATDKWGIHAERITRSSRLIDRWSLFHLPPQFQSTFRILLLVPIGALMISILRNMIGFPTFGIFMPVLMALAFRSTGLFYGICVFAGVILLGYGVRHSMDRLHLLLVPRMSVLLTLVIAFFVALALVGNKFGITEFMAVGLLPFVILTMTIERFFVLVEESGPLEAFRTAGGSAAVAVLTYEIISWDPLQLTFFVYPELLVSIAAIQILIGRYTGYRLSELIRFRMFGKEP